MVGATPARAAADRFAARSARRVLRGQDRPALVCALAQEAVKKCAERGLLTHSKCVAGPALGVGGHGGGGHQRRCLGAAHRDVVSRHWVSTI